MSYLSKKISKDEAAQLLEQELRQLNATPHGRRAFLQAMPLLLAACATTPKTRYNEGDNTGQSAALNPDEEAKMTKEYLPQMRKEYPALEDREVQRYISDLGNNLVQSSGLDNNPYQYNFTVVDTKMVNAFALPAGTIFVTAPLLKMAQTEAELAGVVAHEIGHVKARHTAERLAKAKKEQTKSVIYGAAGALLGGAAGCGLGRLLCPKQDKECLRRASLYGAAAGGLGGLLIQKFAFMANSREDEMEADRIGFRVAHKAGFDKDHVGLFYEKLLKMEQQAQKGQGSLAAPLTDALSTHPPGRDRVAQMRELASSVSNIGDTVSSKRFEAIQKRI